MKISIAMAESADTALTSSLRLPDARFLVLPGYTNAGPEHWMTHWQRECPLLERVQQDDWDHPVCSSWVERLDEAISASVAASDTASGDAAGGDVVLIAHSLGCATIAHWARTNGSRVRAAFLVAPADVERSDFPREIVGFSPMPLDRLPFPSLVVASEDDRFATIERARHFATHWGSRFVSVGRKGHIDSTSGVGRWEDGLELLRGLLSSVGVQGSSTFSAERSQ